MPTSCTASLSRLVDTARSGRRRAAPRGRAMRTMSSTGSIDSASSACPALTLTAGGNPALSVTGCGLAPKPPREQPSAWSAGSFCSGFFPFAAAPAAASCARRFERRGATASTRSGRLRQASVPTARLASRQQRLEQRPPGIRQLVAARYSLRLASHRPASGMQRGLLIKRRLARDARQPGQPWPAEATLRPHHGHRRDGRHAQPDRQHRATHVGQPG